MRFLLRHPLIHTLAGLRGNARACVYTEPMWGLSMNLCLPYMSVFMLALGLNDVQVGAVASIYMASQAVFAFLSGALTDKMGRRKAVAIFDVLGWCVPCAIWAFAVDFPFFIVAAIFNGAMKVPINAWGCLLVEDAEKSQITHIYTLIMICGHVSALFSPITALLISQYTLVPAIRILIINALIVMTLKIIILYVYSRETAIGAVRMKETKNQSYISHIGGYYGVLRMMRKSRGLVFSIIIATLVAIISMINSTFWQIIVSKKLNVPESSLPLFSMFRSIISLFFFFTIISRINQQKLKNPLLFGFLAYFTGQLVLLLIPAEGTFRYIILAVTLMFDGLGAGMLAMLSESMIAIHSDETERARVLAIFQMIVMTLCAPFGWIGGMLSDISRSLPFVLNLVLISAGLIVTLIHYGKDAEKYDNYRR